MNAPHDPDDDLRRLLEEAVAGVEPTHGLDSIRSRTKEHPMNSPHTRRTWFLGAGAAVVATAATIVAVVVVGNGGDDPQADPGFTGGSTTSSPSPDAASSPAESTPSGSPSPTARESQATVPVYYAGDTGAGPRLFREFQSAKVGQPGNDAVSPEVQAALTHALSVQPADPDYHTVWPDGTSATVTRSAEGAWAIDLADKGAGLHDRPSGMTADEAKIALQQLIYTVQGAAQDSSRTPVRFLLDGSPTDAVLGVPTAEPLAAGDPMDVLAQFWIIDPQEGATVSVPFKVTGLAAAFEANVPWELRRGDTVVKKGFTMAEECCTMAPYSFTVKGVKPGNYTLVVHDEDASGGAEGHAVWSDTKQITVK